MGVIADDVVTVVNQTDDGFVTNIVPGVFWYREKSVKVQGRGIEAGESPSCIFPLKALEKYSETQSPEQGVSFALNLKDFIILGEAPEISSVRDINQYSDVITIMTVSRHLKGSPRIRHITVS